MDLTQNYNQQDNGYQETKQNLDSFKSAIGLGINADWGKLGRMFGNTIMGNKLNPNLNKSKTHAPQSNIPVKNTNGGYNNLNYTNPIENPEQMYNQQIINTSNTAPNTVTEEQPPINMEQDGGVLQKLLNPSLYNYSQMGKYKLRNQGLQTLFEGSDGVYRNIPKDNYNTMLYATNKKFGITNPYDYAQQNNVLLNRNDSANLANYYNDAIRLPINLQVPYFESKTQNYIDTISKHKEGGKLDERRVKALFNFLNEKDLDPSVLTEEDLVKLEHAFHYNSGDEVILLYKELVSKHKKGGKINIKKSHRGLFTKYCNGKVTQECIDKGKKSRDPKIRKLATFALNVRSWKHLNGGKINYLKRYK